MKELIRLGNLIPRSSIKWKKKHYDMIDSVINDYDITKGIITVSSDDKIIDGNHRYSILLKKYGDEHIIEIKRKPYSHTFYLIRFWILFLLTWPFLIIHTLLTKNN